ncbi:MAG: hypothetical protein IPN17_23690 [Deltaproteobacteria bacterium]|nr:hypothetical protein [Deltaproteobacteria bacterium]
MDALSEDDKAHRGPRALSSASLSQPFFVAQLEFTRSSRARWFPLKDTIDGREILSGGLDPLPEQAFYQRGGIADVKEAAEQLSKVEAEQSC